MCRFVSQTHALDERYLARVLLANVPPVPERSSTPRPCPRTGSGSTHRAASNAVRLWSGQGPGKGLVKVRWASPVARAAFSCFRSRTFWWLDIYEHDLDHSVQVQHRCICDSSSAMQP